MGGSVPGGHTDTTAVDFWRWAWVTRETHGSKLRFCLSWIWNGKFRISYTSIFFLFSKCITWIKCVLVIFTPIPSLQLPSASQHISLTTSCPFKKNNNPLSPICWCSYAHRYRLIHWSMADLSVDTPQWKRISLSQQPSAADSPTVSGGALGALPWSVLDF